MKDLKTDSAAQLKVKETIVVDKEPSEVEVASAVCVEKEVLEESVAATAMPIPAAMAPAPIMDNSKSFPEPAPDLGARYDVLDFVGSGGMGTVWKVYDKELKETFAIKVLKPELLADDVSLKRFQQEARLATDLTHANIAAIFGPGEDTKGRPYIIMRYVEGESLAETLYMEGALEPERALDIFWQVYAALKHSHMKGIIHRDVKPSNIILTRTESGGDLVQLVDFGISKSIHEEVSKTQALTKAVDVFGSPRYMSPEQFLGKEVGPESDLYSLGCVLYEMLAGHPPFTDENPVKLVLQHLQESPDLSKLTIANPKILSLLLLKDERQRKLLTEDLELFGNEMTVGVSKIEDGFEILVVTLTFYFPCAAGVIASSFSDYPPTILLAPILFCNAGFAMALAFLASNNPIQSRLFKEVRFGISFSFVASVLMSLLAVLVPKSYLLLSFCFLGLGSLLSLTVSMFRQRLDVLIEKLEVATSSSQFQLFSSKLILNTCMFTRMLFIYMAFLPSIAMSSVSSLPLRLALQIPLFLIAISAIAANFGLGLTEIQLEVKGNRLHSTPFKKLSPKRKRNGLIYLTLTGLLAAGLGLGSGKILETMYRNHQLPILSAPNTAIPKPLQETVP